MSRRRPVAVKVTSSTGTACHPFGHGRDGHHVNRASPRKALSDPLRSSSGATPRAYRTARSSAGRLRAQSAALDELAFDQKLGHSGGESKPNFGFLGWRDQHEQKKR